MKNNNHGFIYIDLLAGLSVAALFFLLIHPKILLTPSMQINAQAQYLVSNIRLIQEKNYSQPIQKNYLQRAYIRINKTSYDIYNNASASAVTINMPSGIQLDANHDGIILFNFADKYTASAITIKIYSTDNQYIRKVIINSYGRIRIDD
ncbi:hypothetical protein [Pectinatus brassicae]|uniref:Uncharacterized protein n=1 Tax=Pectinatus brassicae TaxID=862415 RepID=A0A840UHM7_9FIRM|nr:hypothetical protein [Pectinatus brassicae]MBB5336509.1 hypothetical protein [Pectinatus brassicae]